MPMLTIGQLAGYTGVTVRAIRHYHQRGLLAEPERDASGYRRYGATAVVDLIRIRTLSEAGVPLARIQELLTAQPRAFAAAITQIDAGLEQKSRDLSEHRRRIAQLARDGGERLFLPDDVIGILTELRALGVSERTVQLERDTWIVMAALAPDLVAEWARVKLWAMADPEFRRIYLAADEAFGWDADDPRLLELAETMAVWGAKRDREQGTAAEQPGDIGAVVSLMYAHIGEASPAWQKLEQLSQAYQAPAAAPAEAPAAADTEAPATADAP
jgi:DNA-binding transcriptional MerR regulator